MNQSTRNFILYELCRSNDFITIYERDDAVEEWNSIKIHKKYVLRVKCFASVDTPHSCSRFLLLLYNISPFDAASNTLVLKSLLTVPSQCCGVARLPTCASNILVFLLYPKISWPTLLYCYPFLPWSVDVMLGIEWSALQTYRFNVYRFDSWRIKRCQTLSYYFLCSSWILEL